MGIKVVKSKKNRKEKPSEEIVTYYWVQQPDGTARIATMIKKDGRTIIVLKEAKEIKQMREQLQQLAKTGLRKNWI